MEEAMKAILRLATISLVLGASVVLARAQTQAGATLSNDLELNAQQRATIYQTLTKNKLSTPPPPMRVAIGADVPPSAELYTMSDTILSEHPAAKMYKYTVVQNQVVIVDPTTLKVVDIIRP
jgi:hypothetical protein